MSYFIAPLEKARRDYSSFETCSRALLTAVITRANKKWTGNPTGGVQAETSQSILGNILPRDVLGAGTTDWIKAYSVPGSWTNIFSYDVPADQIHGYAGLAFPDETLIFSELRCVFGAKNLPIIDIEEARAWDGPIAIIFKTDVGQEWVVEDGESVQIRGRQERGTSGLNQRVIPLGAAVWKKSGDALSERSEQ